MSENRIKKHQETNMFNSLFHLLFKLLERVVKLPKFPAQLRYALITLIVIAMIQLAMFGAAQISVMAIWYLTR